MLARETHRQAVAQALRHLRQQVQWKPHKEAQHLTKRKRMGHLHGEATVDDYNALISVVVHEADSLLYHYPFSTRDYYAVSGQVEGVTWLVIFGIDGILETAFPPRDLDTYLTKRGFELLGRMGEIYP